MIEFFLVFVAGLLGSAHCIGMCGPFAVTIGSGAPTWRANLAKQLSYTLGRISTYATLGAIAGYVGWQLEHVIPWFVNSAAMLAIFAGGFLLFQGLLAAGVIRRRAVPAKSHACLGTSFLATFLRSPGRWNVFLAGLFTGLLPCGLVYGFLALSASSGHVLSGVALMASFGAGTAPIMILSGWSANLLNYTARRRLYQFAAWCVVVTGLLSIARGCGFLHFAGWESPGCPYCL